MNDKRRAIYTHGYHESVLRSHRRRTAENSAGYLLPYLVPGLSVLDVGCGPGTITVDLAARVVPGSVTGVEPTDDALSLARAEAQLHRLSNISFTTSDVHKLDFPDDAFDVVHAHQVLQHVADPVRALQEMRRVCTPGGIVAARDADYSGFIWFPKLPALDRWLDLYERAARANGGEPDAGRRLLSWARAAGFDDVTPSDVIITTHRPHAQHVGTDAPLGPVIADMLGATAGDLEGADEDAHIADPRAGLPAAIRVVKQSPLLAIGHAYALWLRDTGRVTLCVTQDCDVDADAFNEAADLAAVWQLPVVILVENIRGALSVHLDRYTHEPRVYRRAVAYGMPGVSVDGNDVEAVRDCVANAVVRARAGGGPTLVQAITYRTTDFSGSDRGGYRDLAGSEQFLDPLIFARRRLIAAGTTRGRLDEQERAACQQVADAVAFAKARARPNGGGPISRPTSGWHQQPKTRF